jgi:hypothetical protein
MTPDDPPNVEYTFFGNEPHDIPYQPKREILDKVVIGSYTGTQRRKIIERFKEKKRKRLTHGAFPYKYSVRSNFALTRPRIGGRFLPMPKSTIMTKKKKRAD